MKEIQEYEKDIASIRNMMERSAKFISLSGLSGVLAGLYALAGAAVAYFSLHYPVSPINYRTYSLQSTEAMLKLIMIATAVMVASIGTGLGLATRKRRSMAYNFGQRPAKTWLSIWLYHWYRVVYLYSSCYIPVTLGWRLRLVLYFTDSRLYKAAPIHLMKYDI
jgi:hypothetical protein